MVVSGINYGENVGTCVTVSGTVGAAIEAATLGIPAIAVSLQVDPEHNYVHTEDVDFGAAAHFTKVCAGMLQRAMSFADVDILKLDVPAGATIETPWRITRQSRQYYYEPVKPERVSFDDPVPFRYRIQFDRGTLEGDSDIHALQIDRVVTVTPLSIDLTSRVDLRALERSMRETSHSPVE
jgi:5'-nucleotidase